MQVLQVDNCSCIFFIPAFLGGQRKNLPCRRHLSIEPPNPLGTFESYFILVP